jgi:hypothetical protein
MNTKQFSSNNQTEIIEYIQNYVLSNESLVLIFSDKRFLIPEIASELKAKFNFTPILACSTAGEISGVNVYEGYFSMTTVSFEHTQVRMTSLTIDENDNSYTTGQDLAKSLLDKDLKHIFVLSDGLHVNGTNLVDGINSIIHGQLTVSGGLAGDSVHFVQTLVSDIDGNFSDRTISAIGFYGDKINIRCASEGGWEIFGKDRIVTKSEQNIVYEIDNKPALDLYKSYLGDKAKYLPSSGLLFPLSLKTTEGPVVRTILGINEAENSIRFAGNIPMNSSVKLMKANIDSIITAAEDASFELSKTNKEKNGLMILISCIGRKLVLKQMVQEEVESVTTYFNDDFNFTGFYSYGELSSNESNLCSLHNQTMTLTLITEE